MKIEPIPPASPAFGLNRQTSIRYIAPDRKRIIDNIYLTNGKKLMIAKEYHRDNLAVKLYYLKDAAGNWIKSKLDYFEQGKVTKTLFSTNKEEKCRKNLKTL